MLIGSDLIPQQRELYKRGTGNRAESITGEQSYASLLEKTNNSIAVKIRAACAEAQQEALDVDRARQAEKKRLDSISAREKANQKKQQRRQGPFLSHPLAR